MFLANPPAAISSPYLSTRFQLSEKLGADHEQLHASSSCRRLKPS